MKYEDDSTAEIQIHKWIFFKGISPPPLQLPQAQDWGMFLDVPVAVTVVASQDPFYEGTTAELAGIALKRLQMLEKRHKLNKETSKKFCAICSGIFWP